MTHNKFTTVIVCLCMNISLLHAQQTVDNDRAHRRYWYYRTRMINDFMKIGKDQGDCIFSKNLHNSILNSKHKSKIKQ